MMESLDYLLEVVSRAEHMGERTLSNGVRLIGHVPHMAPEAYFHVTYPPLNEGQIDSLEKAIGRELPFELRAFYHKTNGVKLFGYSLSIDGLRHSYVRVGDEAWQPYSIVTPNTIERPPDADESLVFIGGYRWDGSQLCMTPNSPVVYRCQFGTAKVLNKWSSFDEMLTSEVNRLSTLFDEKGRKIDADAPTAPAEEVFEDGGKIDRIT